MYLIFIFSSSATHDTVPFRVCKSGLILMTRLVGVNVGNLGDAAIFNMKRNMTTTGELQDFDNKYCTQHKQKKSKLTAH